MRVIVLFSLLIFNTQALELKGMVKKTNKKYWLHLPKGSFHGQKVELKLNKKDKEIIGNKQIYLKLNGEFKNKIFFVKTHTPAIYNPLQRIDKSHE